LSLANPNLDIFDRKSLMDIAMATKCWPQ